MSAEYDNNKSYQAQSSEVLDGSAGSINPDMDYVRPAEIPEQPAEPDKIPCLGSDLCGASFSCLLVYFLPLVVLAVRPPPSPKRPTPTPSPP